MLKNLLLSLLFLGSLLFFPLYSISSTLSTPSDRVLNDALYPLTLQFFDTPCNLKEFSSPTDIAEAGNGNSSIFFAYAPHGDPIGILKLIPSNHPKTSSEIDALFYLNTLSFNTLSVPTLRGTAELIHQGEHFTIIAETIAPGKTINSYLKEIPYTKNAALRKELLKELTESLTETAKALSELHALTGTAHGDVHPGNIFYDSITHQVTLIDFADSGPYDSAYDVANLLVTLEIIGSYYKLPETLLTTLKESFLTSYTNLNPTLSRALVEEYSYKLFSDYASGSNDTLPYIPESDEELFLHTFAKTKISKELRKNSLRHMG